MREILRLNVNTGTMIKNVELSGLSIATWKGVYPYEYMDDCEKFNEVSLLMQIKGMLKEFVKILK